MHPTWNKLQQKQRMVFLASLKSHKKKSQAQRRVWKELQEAEQRVLKS